MVEKSDDFHLLYYSHICRLCGEENANGSFMYDDENQNVSYLINHYLPIKISDDGRYPRWICPGCRLQVESTVEFFDLVLAGQERLRILMKKEMSWTMKDNDALEQISSVEQHPVYDKGLFNSNHKIYKFFKSINKPKRKRGRPPKPSIEVQLAKQMEAEAEARKLMEKKEEEELKMKTDKSEGRRRRNIKIPSRFQEVVQGKELERIYLEKGVIDKSDALSEGDSKDTEMLDYTDDLIGHLQDNNGQNIGELVLNNGHYHKKKKTKFICDICSRSFTQEFRFLAHRGTHYNVRYECTECEEQFETRILLSNHQSEIGHRGEGIIENLEEIELKPFDVDEINDESEKTSLDTTEHLTELNMNFLRNTTSICEAKLNEKHFVKMENTHPALIAGDVEMGRGFDMPSIIDAKANLLILTSDEHPITALSSTSTELNALNTKVKKMERGDCNVCNRSFIDTALLETHFQLVHGPNAEKTVKQLDVDATDLNALEDDFKYNCDQCSRLFKTPSSLLYHKESEHNEGRRFACSKCDKSFKHKQLLQRHHLVHTNERPYPCETCGASFKSKQNLLNHLSTHTGIKKYECTICKQSFAHKTSLKLHYRWHSGSKPFSCKECGKTFTQNGNLQEHMRIHTGERPYACMYCDKRFKTSSQMRIHHKRHQNIKPYKCEICQKSFLHGEIYRTHFRRHNNQKPFTCSYCDKAFSEQWALKKHKRIHTGEKPYQCPVCNKAFSDCSNLTKHRKIHHTQLRKIATDSKPSEPVQNTNESQGNGVLLSLLDNGDLSEQSTRNQVTYVTYQDTIDTDKNKMLEVAKPPVQSDFHDTMLPDNSSGNICLSNDTMLTDSMHNVEYMDATSSSHYVDTAIGYVDGKQLTASHLQLTGEHIQVDLSDINNQLSKGLIQIERGVGGMDNHNGFDKYGQAIELITSDGRKLRLLTQYPEQQLDLASEFISIS